MKRRLIQNTPAGILLLGTLFLVTWLCLSPRAGDLPPPPIPGLGKIAHCILFGGLGFLTILTLIRPDRRCWQGLWIIPLITGYGLLIEVIQPSVGRTFEWSDMAFDALGAVLAWGALALKAIWFPTKDNNTKVTL